MVAAADDGENGNELAQRKNQCTEGDGHQDHGCSMPCSISNVGGPKSEGKHGHRLQDC
ncbi:hypothetical protein SSKA14_1315 [Stenotrophomonas sp. SKA14]|nr:hypothetical protein SSKA14_1315 [Stenotrophomonas sp. SKA14]